MSTLFKCLMLIACLSIYSCLKCEEELDVQEQIFAKYASNTKSLFKVWHFIYNKEYDYNTEEGIRRYRIFKKNVMEVKRHNVSKSSYKMGLNNLSDMTDEEITEYYNIKPITDKDMIRNLRSLKGVSLDDFNEDEQEIRRRPSSNIGHSEHKPIDHRENMRPVRSQKRCGSCWAFTTQAVLEGVLAMQEGAALDDWISTQQSVDCDPYNGGCNGGWFRGALTYFKENNLIWEKEYPYEAIKRSCKYDDKKKSQWKLEGFLTYIHKRSPAGGFDEQLQRGPVAVAVAASCRWYRYKKGIFDGTCSSQVNHAVTLVGYGKTEKTECTEGAAYWIIRNSWGLGWGEQGHMRVKHDDENSFSCNIEKYAYQPTKLVR